LAEAALASVLERMGEAMGRHQADMAELVGRCEDAIAAVADPEALSAELAATRAEVALVAHRSPGPGGPVGRGGFGPGWNPSS